MNTKPEDSKAPAGDQLNWWQASNVHLLSSFLEKPMSNRTSEGIVLCDAPGLGKTVSVLATAVSTMDTEGLVIIFAGKGIIDNVWVEQIGRHFDSEETFSVYCADSEKSKHEFAQALSTREAGAKGGVYVDQRSAGRLPPLDKLLTFRMLVLPKEMLSQGEPKPEAPMNNFGRIKQLAHHARLIVVDESHNLNKQTITRQEVNLLDTFPGVQKLLLTGTPGSSAGEIYRFVRMLRHKSVLQKKQDRNGRLNAAAASAAAARVQVADDIIMSEKQWRGKFFEAASDLVRADREEALVELLNECFLHSPKEVSPSKVLQSVERVELFPSEVDAYNFALSLHQRDVLRATPGRKQPDDWYSTKPFRVSYSQQKKKAGPEHLPKPSGEKTMGDLMRAANGGEIWSLALPESVNEDSAPEGIKAALKRNIEQTADLHECDVCQIRVPGLLQLPCKCPGEVCPECFVEFKCNLFERKLFRRFKCPLGCRKKQQTHQEWAPSQPRLLLQTDDVRKLEKDLKESKTAQLKQQKEARDKAKKEKDAAAADGGEEEWMRSDPPELRLARRELRPILRPHGT